MRLSHGRRRCPLEGADFSTNNPTCRWSACMIFDITIAVWRPDAADGAQGDEQPRLDAIEHAHSAIDLSQYPPHKLPFHFDSPNRSCPWRADGRHHRWAPYHDAAPKYIHTHIHLFCFRSLAAFACSALSTGTKLGRVDGCPPPTSNFRCRGLLRVPMTLRTPSKHVMLVMEVVGSSHRPGLRL